MILNCFGNTLCFELHLHSPKIHTDYLFLYSSIFKPKETKINFFALTLLFQKFFLLAQRVRQEALSKRTKKILNKTAIPCVHMYLFCFCTSNKGISFFFWSVHFCSLYENCVYFIVVALIQICFILGEDSSKTKKRQRNKNTIWAYTNKKEMETKTKIHMLNACWMCVCLFQIQGKGKRA